MEGGRQAVVLHYSLRNPSIRSLQCSIARSYSVTLYSVDALIQIGVLEQEILEQDILVNVNVSASCIRSQRQVYEDVHIGL